MDNKTLSTTSFWLGIASILGSILIWISSGGRSANKEEQAHGERFGIFVGLWAPTFFILSDRFKKADEDGEQVVPGLPQH